MGKASGPSGSHLESGSFGTEGRLETPSDSGNRCVTTIPPAASAVGPTAVNSIVHPGDQLETGR